MRVVFFGTPGPAAVALEAILAAGHDVAAVVTQPDRRRGRGGAALPSPVKAVAERHGLIVLTPERAGELTVELAAYGAELGIVVAFGQLLPEAVLDAFPRGCINVHFSLLPRWRGAAPVERALLAGDSETGVAIMQMETGLDTGPVWAQTVVAIAADDTAGTLLDRLSRQGAQLLVETIPELDARRPVPQVGESTYAAKLQVEEFRIDWSRSARDLDRLVRAGNPRPGAWTTLEGARFKVLDAVAVSAVTEAPGVFNADGVVATGDGALRLARVQPEGKAPMEAAAWLTGRRGAGGRFNG